MGNHEVGADTGGADNAVAYDPSLSDTGGGLRRAALSGAVWSLAQAWGGRVVSTAAFLILARELSPKDFGVVALAAIFIDLGQILINRGFGATIVQRETLTDDDIDTAFWFSLGVGVALATVSWVTAGPIAGALDEPELAPVLRVLSLNWVLGAFWSVPQNLLQRELKFRSLALRRLLAVTISGVVAVVLAIAGAGVWSLVALALVQSVVSIAVLWTVSPWRPSRRWSRSSLRAMRGMALSVAAIDLLGFFAARGEGLVIGIAISPIALGYYAVAQRFLQLLNEVFTSTIGAVAFPVFSRLQGDDERRAGALQSVVRLTSLAAIPAFTGLAVLAPEVVGTMLGPTWVQSVVLVQLLAIRGLRFSVTYFVSSVIVSTGNATLELRLSIVGVSVKMMALAVGVQFGVVGVAWAVVVSSYLTLPITLWGLHKATHIGPRAYLRPIVEPAVAAAAMCAAVGGLRVALAALSDPFTLAVCVVAGGLVYVGVIAMIAPGLLMEVRRMVRETAGRQRAKGSGASPTRT